MSDLINNQKIAKLSDVQKYAVWNYNNNNNNLNLNNYKSNHITTDCTWLYFIKKILPSACQIQASINDITKLMAITNNTFSDNNLSLFKWNNNFSWYYHNGLNLEIRKRIQSLGGNFFEVLKNIQEVSSDLKFNMSGVSSPSVFAGKLTISGE